MYLEQDSWLPFAKDLVPGGRKYHEHTCGGGKTLVVSCDEKGWSGYCFRCGLSGYKSYGTLTLAEIRKIQQAIQSSERAFEQQGFATLPPDFTLDIPVKYLVWLSMCGIFASTARRYGFGYSADMKRVVLPIYKDGDLIFLQARAVETGRKPKYLNQSAVPKQTVLFESMLQDGDVCCVTEDIASAVRVGELMPTYSTLGTKLSPEQANQISDNYRYCIIWYDDDYAGKSGCIKAISVLRMLGIKCCSICTSQDPKKHTNQEILDILTGGTCGRNRPYNPTDTTGTRIIREDVQRTTLGMFG